MYHKKHLMSEIQFVCPGPKGSELIFFAPFRVWGNRENQFAVWYLNGYSYNLMVNLK